MTKNTYTVRYITDVYELNAADRHFIYDAAHRISSMYDHDFNADHFSMETYIKEGGVLHLWYKRGLAYPIGAWLARPLESIFDREVKILYQDLLYVEPGNSRLVPVMLRVIIDFARLDANHLITCVGRRTNIKGRSLEKLGFKKLEELYRMEF